MSFSTKRPLLRALISSVLPKSIMKMLGSGTGNKAVPELNVSVPIVIWVQLIIALLCPWTSDSKELWTELLGYRIDKAYLCKNADSFNEHEFIVVDLADEQGAKLQLRVDRATGERKTSRSTSPSSSTTSFDSDSNHSHSASSPTSPRIYGRRSSRSSLSVASTKEGLTKVTHSLRHAVRQLSEDSLSRSSAIVSNKYLAADTVQRISGIPKNAKIVRTIQFGSADRRRRPSLWDLMILSYVIHQDSTSYELLDRQCFWFADTISALLEKWSDDISVKQSVKITKSSLLRRKSNASCGSVKGFTLHHRNADDINKLWAQFLEEKKEMDQKRQEFEDAKTAEAKRTEELEQQVAALKKQQEKEREEQERERRALEKKEQQLKKRMLNQERLQERLQQQLQESNLRFQELEEQVKRLSYHDT